jgi:hypothetical protein
LKKLLYYVAGAIFCIGLGIISFVLRVPLRGRGKEFGPLEQTLSGVIIGIGVVYGLLAVREFFLWRGQRRPRRRKKRSP